VRTLGPTSAATNHRVPARLGKAIQRKNRVFAKIIAKLNIKSLLDEFTRFL